MSPIRVLELTAGLAVGDPLGGAARFIIELAKAFDKTLVEPFLGCLWKYETPPEKYWSEVLDTASIPYAFATRWRSEHPLLSCIAALRGLEPLRGFRPDILHCHGEFTDIAAILLKRRLGARYLVRTRHSTIEWPKRPALGRIFGHWVYPWLFDMEIAVSNQAANALNQRTFARFRHRKAICIYNAIDFQRFETARQDTALLKQHWRIPENAVVIGTVGALSKVKGYDILLKAFRIVISNAPNVYLMIVGDGPERSALQTQAKSIGVEDRVCFLGAQPTIEHIYPVFDLFVSSSRVEGLPTVLLESIASGVPVIATDIPGTREIIEDNVTGLLVPPENPEALANALLQALQSPWKMELLATAALQKVKQRFTIESITKQYTSLFYHLMAGAPKTHEQATLP